MAIPKRRFGRTGLEVSALGFGCMRLPVIGDDKSKIDYPEATKMLRRAIDAGVNYVDTAYPYHGNDFPNAGESEPFVGKALKDGYREKVYVATKLPQWTITKRGDMDRFLDEQLERLDIGCIDVYLAHNLNANSWPRLRDLGLIPFLESAVADGRIKHPGFSFHANFDMFREIMDHYDWPVVQIQYNYLDTAYQAGEAGLRLAAEKNAAIAIMEPLRGGFLINNVPEKLKDMLREIRPEWSLADWGLRWIWDQPEPGTVLSGMSTMEQVEENIRIVSSPAEFGDPEREALVRVREWFTQHLPVNCTACGYCLPCPKGVNIPGVFTYFNEYHLADDEATHTRASLMYKLGVADGERADSCVACGVCEKRCPQNIPIAAKMKDAAAALG